MSRTYRRDPSEARAARTAARVSRRKAEIRDMLADLDARVAAAARAQSASAVRRSFDEPTQFGRAV